MLLTRTKLWLTVWVLTFLMGAPVLAQGVRDMTLFSPPEISTYGGGIRPHEGLFFNFDFLYMGANRPDVTPIGDEELGRAGVTVYRGPSTEQSYTEFNSVDTSFIKTKFTAGQRFEIGNITEHHGWLLGGFQMQMAAQTMIVRDAHVLFRDTLAESGTGFLEGPVDINGAFRVDGRFPRLPTVFNYLKARSEIQPWGMELSYIYRTHPTHHGGIFEFMFGVRYLDIKDAFRVYGLDAPPMGPFLASSGGGGAGRIVSSSAPQGVPTTGGNDNTGGGGTDIIGRTNGVPAAPVAWTDQPNILADSYWNTVVDNQMVGPQIGVRHFQSWGRWTLVGEARFCAALNTQNFTQDGLIGSKLHPGEFGLPLVAEATSFNHQATRYRFSPITECRLEAVLELTKTMSIGAGWNGMYIGNVARAANSIDYAVPYMGLDLSNNEQNIFMNGLSLKFMINR